MRMGATCSRAGLRVSCATPSANAQRLLLLELLAVALAGLEVKKIQNVRISGAVPLWLQSSWREIAPHLTPTVRCLSLKVALTLPQTDCIPLAFSREKQTRQMILFPAHCTRQHCGGAVSRETARRAPALHSHVLHSMPHTQGEGVDVFACRDSQSFLINVIESNQLRPCAQVHHHLPPAVAAAPAAASAKVPTRRKEVCVRVALAFQAHMEEDQARCGV